MVNFHDHFHRRHARAANPFAAAWAEAEAVADALANPAQAASTVVSVVYVTQSPTFTGAVGGYTTLGVAINTDSSKSAAKATTTTEKSSAPTGIVADTSTTKNVQTPTTMATSIVPDTSSLTSVPTSILAATSALSVATTSHSSTSTTADSSSSSASSTSSADSTASSGGMSTAGKAGLAIGILLLVGAVLTMVLFCFRRRREKQGQMLEDEKHDLAVVAPPIRRNSTSTNATTRTAATAPRLSLRPVTQFMPHLSEKRTSKATLLNIGGNGANTQMQAQDNKLNPFGNHAETIDSANAAGPELVKDVTPAGAVVMDTPSSNVLPLLKRGASKRNVNGEKAQDFTKAGPFMGPPSPSGTEFSMSSEAGTPVQTATSVAIAAAGGPANSAVHRVQLDFLPSMGDELELRAGQLVRVLHEFDDGWAMCIRLDRSQQGVCPRTCLSARPVKPRPNNGPAQGPRSPPQLKGPGPQMRPQAQGRPMTPNGQSQRPMTPQGQPGNAMVPRGLQPRPITPTGPTGPLPGTPAQRSRAGSTASVQSRSQSPPDPSPMNPVVSNSGSSPPTDSPISRKPVPGQAL